MTETLTILRRLLQGELTDIVHGFGGGEMASVEALIHLKENYVRRDVMTNSCPSST